MQTSDLGKVTYREKKKKNKKKKKEEEEEEGEEEGEKEKRGREEKEEKITKGNKKKKECLFPADKKTEIPSRGAPRPPHWPHRPPYARPRVHILMCEGHPFKISFS